MPVSTRPTADPRPCELHSSSGQGRTDSGLTPARTDQLHPGWPGVADCLQPWLDEIRESPLPAEARGHGTAWLWRRRSACRESAAPAVEHTEESAPTAGACNLQG